MNKTIFKSVGAVLAGFLTVVVLSIATDTILEKLGFFPPIGGGLFVPWMLLLALAYRSAYTVAGGYVTARLSPNRAMRHVVILGIIGLVAGTLGAIAGWNLSAHWYPILLAITGPLFVWLGGKLYLSKQIEKA